MVLLNTWQQMRSGLEVLGFVGVDVTWCGCLMLFLKVQLQRLRSSTTLTTLWLWERSRKSKTGSFKVSKPFTSELFDQVQPVSRRCLVSCRANVWNVWAMYELHIDIIDIMMYLKRWKIGKYVSKHWVCFELRRGLGALARAWRVLSKSSCWISSVLFLNSILRARERTTWIRVYKGTRFELLKKLPLRPVNVTHIVLHKTHSHTEILNQI